MANQENLIHLPPLLLTDGWVDTLKGGGVTIHPEMRLPGFRVTASTHYSNDLILPEDSEDARLFKSIARRYRDVDYEEHPVDGGRRPTALYRLVGSEAALQVPKVHIATAFYDAQRAIKARQLTIVPDTPLPRASVVRRVDAVMRDFEARFPGETELTDFGPDELFRALSELTFMPDSVELGTVLDVAVGARLVMDATNTGKANPLTGIEFTFAKPWIVGNTTLPTSRSQDLAALREVADAGRAIATSLG